MKKLMVSMAVAVLASVSFANASNITEKSSSPVIVAALQEKVEIKPEELPDAVKTTLGNETYQSWQVQKAFIVPTNNGDQIYEIALAKGEETQTVKLDKDGKVVE